MKEVGSRVVERGDHVDQSLRAIHEEKEATEGTPLPEKYRKGS
jgi:hypothetical protein